MLNQFKTLRDLINPFSEKEVEIEFTQTCFVDQQQYVAGQKATLKESQAREVVAAGRGIDHAEILKAQTKRQRLKALIPALGEPAPIPEGWDKLPKCFSSFWKLNQKGLVLIHHRDEIEARLIKRISRSQFGRASGVDQLSADAQSKIFGGLSFGIGEPDPQETEETHALKNAYQRAYEDVKEWQAANTPELARLQMECSDAMQKTHGELCRNITELHGLALDLFKTRIAPLGLGAFDIARLFVGSADAARFGQIEKPSMQGLRLAWNEDGGRDIKFYVDFPVATLAYLIKGYHVTAAEVERLKKEATAELKRAQSVVVKAA